MILTFKRALLAIILAQGAQSDIQLAESPQIQPRVCNNSSLEVRASDELCSQVPRTFIAESVSASSLPMRRASRPTSHRACSKSAGLGRCRGTLLVTNGHWTILVQTWTPRIRPPNTQVMSVPICWESASRFLEANPVARICALALSSRKRG